MSPRFTLPLSEALVLELLTQLNSTTSHLTIGLVWIHEHVPMVKKLEAVDLEALLENLLLPVNSLISLAVLLMAKELVKVVSVSVPAWAKLKSKLVSPSPID